MTIQSIFNIMTFIRLYKTGLYNIMFSKKRQKAPALILSRGFLLFLQQVLYTQSSFRCFFHTIKSSESEIAFTVRAKSASRCADYVCFFKQAVKKLPGTHALRTLHPNIRGIRSTGIVYINRRSRSAIIFAFSR